MRSESISLYCSHTRGVHGRCLNNLRSGLCTLVDLKSIVKQR